eukprot:8919374-Alexandrium_andersonii.AAC.1
MNKCINAGKAKPDPNFPDDPEERFYWVLIDSTLALDTTLEDSVTMEGNDQIDAEQAQEILGDDTGIFGANSLPRIEGMNPKGLLSFAGDAMGQSMGSGGAPPPKAKAKAKA